MMNSIYYGIGGILMAAGITAYTSVKTPDPVAVNAEIISLEKFDDRVEIMVAWENVRNCEFSSLSTMQGSFEFPDDLRTPISRQLGKPKGPRGIGRQQTVKPWIFYRPEVIHGPDFIMTAWHRCDDRAVPSTMLVEDMRVWFPQ